MNFSQYEKFIVYKNVTTEYTINIIGDVFHIKGENRYLLKPSYDKDGYRTVTLHVNNKPYFCRVCRLVGLTFIDIPEELSNYDISELQINHINGIHDDDYVKNLEWVTPKGNIEHAWRTGLSKPKYCDEHPNSVYTNDDIHKVCKLISSGVYTYKEISNMTGVSYTVVKQIKNHVIWNQISKDYTFPDKIKRGNSSPLKKEVIENIVNDIKLGTMTFEEISKKYDTTSSTISKIRHDYM